MTPATMISIVTSSRDTFVRAARGSEIADGHRNSPLPVSALYLPPEPLPQQFIRAALDRSSLASLSCTRCAVQNPSVYFMMFRQKDRQRLHLTTSTGWCKNRSRFVGPSKAMQRSSRWRVGWCLRSAPGSPEESGSARSFWHVVRKRGEIRRGKSWLLVCCESSEN